MGTAYAPQRAPSKPFVGTDAARRARLAKVHIAKKDLQLDEDDYRQILLDETGHTSASDCSAAELDRVIRRFEGRGWKPKPKKPGARGTARHPMARKARALWISLYHLGAVRSRDEKALEAFAKRQLGCDRLVWAKQSDGYRLIEALKAMAVKHGWAQVDASGNNLSVRGLQEGLCKAILAKLVEAGEVPADWTIDIAAWRLCGIETAGEAPMSAEGYSDLAAALGRKLRDAGGAA